MEKVIMTKQTTDDNCNGGGGDDGGVSGGGDGDGDSDGDGFEDSSPARCNRRYLATISLQYGVTGTASDAKHSAVAVYELASSQGTVHQYGVTGNAFPTTVQTVE